MINTGKKDVIYGYISYFLKAVSNVIVLPLVLRLIPTQEYGLWCVFLSIGAFVSLADMGFNTVIVRNITYAFCGADKLKRIGKPDMSLTKTANYKLLFQVYHVSKKIYIRISLLAGAIILGMGFYILFISGDTIPMATSATAWAMYGLSVCMSLFFLPITCIYKGLGRIKEIQLIQLKNQLIYIACQIIFVVLGWGIIALALSNLLVNLILRLQMSGLTRSLIKEHPKEYNLALRKDQGEIKEIYQIISGSSKGMGAIMVSSFLQSQGMTLLSSYFLSLNVIASFGLVNQLIGMVTALSNVPFITFQTKMSEYQLKNENEKLKDLFSMVSLFLHITYLCGGLAILLAGKPVMFLIQSNTGLLPWLPVSLMIAYNWILSNHQRCTSFIALGNAQPFVFSYVASSLASVLTTAVALSFAHNVYALIIPGLLIQCIYNGWKWQREVNARVHLDFISMLQRCVVQLTHMRLLSRRQER